MAVKYNQYAFLLNAMATMWLKKKYHTKAERQKRGLTGALKEFLPQMPQIFQVMDGAIMAEEWQWMTHKKMIFPESIETLENLSKGNFRIEAAKGLYPPYESFVVNFPKGFKLCDIEVPGMMITFGPVKERAEKLFKPFIKTIGFENFDLERMQITGIHQNSENDSFLAITYSTEKIGDNHVMSRICIPWEILPVVLSAKDGKEYKATVGTFPEVSQKGYFFDLTDKENEFQFELVKLLTKMFIYIQASGALVPGFPSTKEKDEIPMYVQRNGSLTSPYIFKLNHQQQDGIPKAAHYRSFTIRQLRNERYYKGEYEHKERGSRFVFVRDTYVGAKVDPETLIETEE